MKQNWNPRKRRKAQGSNEDGKKTEKEAFREAEAFEGGVRIEASKRTGRKEMEAVYLKEAEDLKGGVRTPTMERKGSRRLESYRRLERKPKT